MLNLAVFISGGGRSLRNLIAERDAGRLDVRFALVISSNPSAGGLRHAEEAGIEALVVRKADYSQDPDGYREAMFQPCRDRGVDLVVMAGYMKHVWIPDDFQGRVINIHPSLIPAFCGAAMYGDRVHAAAIERGVKVSGCTVHFVDNEYDNGPIILQRVCTVEDDDTPEILAARVFAEECQALPEAIRRFSRGELCIEGRRVIGQRRGT